MLSCWIIGELIDVTSGYHIEGFIPCFKVHVENCPATNLVRFIHVLSVDYTSSRSKRGCGRSRAGGECPKKGEGRPVSDTITMVILFGGD